MKKIVLLMLTIAVMALTANAKPRVWGTGGDKGNYYGMSGEILEVCKNTHPKKPDELLTTKGSDENTHLALRKKVRVWWTSYGTLKINAVKNDKLHEKSHKVVSVMHLEPLNVLMPFNWKPKKAKGSWYSDTFDKAAAGWDNVTGTKKAPIKISLELLKGQKIASSGGSVKEAEALVKFAHLTGAKVVAMEESKLVDSGMPIILVGGAPYAPVENILNTGKYTLVSVDSRKLARDASFYEDTSISYKIKNKYVTIPTIGVRAVIMGKVSKKKLKYEDVKDQGMRTLAGCISENMGDIAEDSDNPNWENASEYNDSDEMLNWSAFKPYKAGGDSSEDEEETED